MSLFKITFDRTFENKYGKINDYNNRRPKYSKIRVALAHAKNRDIKDDKEYLESLSLDLFNPILELLKIMRFEVIEIMSNYK